MSNFKLEEDFLNKLAEAYTTFSISPIQDLITDDFSYSSLWVWGELKSRESYLDYLKRKLESMKKANVNNRFLMMYCNRSGVPVLLLSQKTEAGDRGVFVVTKTENGKIKELNLTSSEFYSLKPKNEKEYNEFMKKYN